MIKPLGNLASDSLRPHFEAAYARIAHYAIRKFLHEWAVFDDDGNAIIEKLPDGAFDEWVQTQLSGDIYKMIFTERVREY